MSPGYTLHRDVLSPAIVRSYLASLASRGFRDMVGVRNLVALVPETLSLLTPEVLILAGPGATLVRATLFDKPPRARWSVPWHQDVVVPVSERLPGHSAFTQKGGVLHARAPREVLERMITVRLHLDECGLESGPVRALPGTHTLGVLLAGRISALAATVTPEVCLVPAGGAMVMRPLLVHSSGTAQDPSRHRRVVHLEFAGAQSTGL